MKEPAYEIVANAEGEDGIKCLECGNVSYNAQDVEHKYCGNCHRFLALVEVDLDTIALTEMEAKAVLNSLIKEYVSTHDGQPDQEEIKRQFRVVEKTMIDSKLSLSLLQMALNGDAGLAVDENGEILLRLTEQGEARAKAVVHSDKEWNLLYDVVRQQQKEEGH